MKTKNSTTTAVAAHINHNSNFSSGKSASAIVTKDSSTHIRNKQNLASSSSSAFLQRQNSMKDNLASVKGSQVGLDNLDELSPNASQNTLAHLDINSKLILQYLSNRQQKQDFKIEEHLTMLEKELKLLKKQMVAEQMRNDNLQKQVYTLTVQFTADS